MILGNVLKKWRLAHEITIRQAAKDMGIGFSTLSRIENGETMDGITLARIFSWLTSEVRQK